MKKKYIVKNERDFNKIINKNNYLKSKKIVIYYEDNDLNYDKFGISVGKKLGNAVTRNKYKRKLRSIIDEYRKDYNNSKNYIIILRRGGINCSYKDLKEDFFKLILTRKDK